MVQTKKTPHFAEWSLATSVTSSHKEVERKEEENEDENGQEEQGPVDQLYKLYCKKVTCMFIYFSIFLLC